MLVLTRVLFFDLKGFIVSSVKKFLTEDLYAFN
jgi:hypothetical protein